MGPRSSNTWDFAKRDPQEFGEDAAFRALRDFPELFEDNIDGSKSAELALRGIVFEIMNSRNEYSGNHSCDIGIEFATTALGVAYGIIERERLGIGVANE